MSPQEALQSDIFRIYLLIIVSLLLSIGLLLSLLRFGLKKSIQPIWTIYRGWLIICPTILILIFLGRGTFILGILLISIFGFKEFARATGIYRDWWMTGGVYLCMLFLGIVSWCYDPRSGTPGWYGMYMTLPVFSISLLLMIPILKGRSHGQVQVVALSILGYVYIGWMFGYLGYIANADHAYGYILYLIFAVELNDISAYIFGKSFGKHKLCENISPNKTWEGSLGALAISMILPWVLHFSFPHFGWFQLVLTGLIVGIGGQLGDLIISFIKRDIGVKDMGALIPGHGGILDRIDSMIFVAPLFFHMVRWFYDIYS